MTGGAADPRSAARREVVGAVLVFLTLLVTASFVLLAISDPADRGSPVAVECGMLAQLVGSVLALGVAMSWRSSASWRGDGRILRPLSSYLAFLPIWLLVAVGVSAMWRALDWPVAPQAHLEYFAAERGFGSLFVVLATVCAVGPVIEEVIFRGYLQTGLSTLFGPRAALWGSAVLFGLVHVGSGSVLFVPITLLGLLFGWLRQRSGGLLAGIVAHVAHNTLTVLVVMTAPEILQPLHNP